MKIHDFDSLLPLSSNKHVLLGNGFSIDCNPIFKYEALYNSASFNDVSEFTQDLFGELDTWDFEKVMQALRVSAQVIKAHKGDKRLINRLEEDADALKSILIESIAKSHLKFPSEIPTEEYMCCIEFLKHFDRKYYLNYDLLLYWTLMQGEDKLSFDDGFRKAAGKVDYVEWDFNANSQNVYYLHGALHLFDSPSLLKKYTWKNTQIALIDQIKRELEGGFYPLFVSEGDSKDKYSKIIHSGYLSRCVRSIGNIGGSLFVHGHSFADNDDHILNFIPESKVKNLCISVFGDISSVENKAKLKKAEKLKGMRGDRNPLNIFFYQSESANVWR